MLGPYLNISKCLLVLKYPELLILIPKVGWRHGEKVCSSRISSFAFWAPLSHLCQLQIMFQFQEFPQPVIKSLKDRSSMVTVKVILVNPIWDSTGTTYPATSASIGPANLGLIICHLPWESQMRPNFQNPFGSSPHQRSPALALGAQINFLLFRSALSEVQPVLLQSAVKM